MPGLELTNSGSWVFSQSQSIRAPNNCSWTKQIPIVLCVFISRGPPKRDSVKIYPSKRVASKEDMKREKRWLWWIPQMRSTSFQSTEWAIFCLFSSFQTLQFLEQIYVKKCPFSIRCWDSNPRTSGHGSPLITTRPTLPPNLPIYYFGQNNSIKG